MVTSHLQPQLLKLMLLDVSPCTISPTNVEFIETPPRNVHLSFKKKINGSNATIVVIKCARHTEYSCTLGFTGAYS